MQKISGREDGMSVVWSLNYFVFMLFDYILPLIGLNERWQTVRNRIEACFFYLFIYKKLMCTMQWSGIVVYVNKRR